MCNNTINVSSGWGGDIYLGVWGESRVREITFDISSWILTHGEGTLQILVNRPGETLDTGEPLVYAATDVTVVDGIATWTVTDVDTAINGSGSCALVYLVGDDVVTKTPAYRTRIKDTLGHSGATVPSALEAWYTDIIQASAAAQSAAERAEGSLDKQPYPNAETGTWWRWNSETGAWEDTGEAYGDGTYILPAATTTTLGGVKVGDGLTVGHDGTLAANAQDRHLINTLSVDTGDGTTAIFFQASKRSPRIETLGTLYLVPAVAVDLSGKRITNLATPSGDSDAATKAYVDLRVAPAIIEGDWMYRVKADNTFEAWYTATGQSLVITAQSGALYRSDLQVITLPVGLTAGGRTCVIKHVSINAAHNNYPTWGVLASVQTPTENTFKYYALSGDRRLESPHYTITAYVAGSLGGTAT